MPYEEQQAALQCLREAREWVQQAHDEADKRHSSYGEYYMDSTLFEIMAQASDLMQRIDSIIEANKDTSDAHLSR